MQSITTIPTPATGVAWLDALTIVLVAAMTSLTSFFAIRAHRTSEAIKAQVVNGHADSPPMRADLDRAIAAIDQLGHEVRGIRQDMISEEQRRRSHIDELRQDVDRRFHELQKRIH